MKTAHARRVFATLRRASVSGPANAEFLGGCGRTFAQQVPPLLQLRQQLLGQQKPCTSFRYSRVLRAPTWAPARSLHGSGLQEEGGDAHSSRCRLHTAANVELAKKNMAMSTSGSTAAQFWPSYSAPPSPPSDDAFFCVFLGTYPATPQRVNITHPDAPWENPTCAKIHKGLGFSREGSQRVGIVNLIEWYHPVGSTKFIFPETFALGAVNLKDWEDRLESDLKHFLQQNPGKRPLLYVGGQVPEKALRKSRFDASIGEFEEDNPGVQPRVIRITITGTICCAVICAHPSPRSIQSNQCDENDQSTVDQELSFVRLIAQGHDVSHAREMVNEVRNQKKKDMQSFLMSKGATNADLTFIDAEKPGILYQELTPFQAKWDLLHALKSSVLDIFGENTLSNRVLIVNALQDKGACEKFLLVTHKYQISGDVWTAKKARSLVKAANNDEMRGFLELVIPIQYWPRILDRSGIGSIINSGKTADFVKFLTGFAIPKDKWHALLSCDGLCSAIVEGKGDDLLGFLTQTGLSKDKWYALLSCDGLCSMICKGKGGNLIDFFVINKDIPNDKWPGILSPGSFCSAIGKGKGRDLVNFLNENDIPKDKWPSILSRNSFCSAIANGRGQVLVQFLTGNEIPKDKWPTFLSSDRHCSKIANGKGHDILHSLIRFSPTD